MKNALFIACLFSIQMLAAKTMVVGLTTKHISGTDIAYASLQGGDTLLLQGGTRAAIQFANLQGSPGQYITIINADGPVCQINDTVLPYGISIRNCHYVRLAGNGCAQNPYGIKIAGVSKDGAGLGISDKTDNIEICYIEICNTKGPGILCKTNPDCLTWRDNYTMLNTSIHHNYVHHTGTEGMYIGSTAFEGTPVKCDSTTTTRLPPLLQNVDVYNNIVTSTGWDGIQISNALNVKCYNNAIDSDSQKDEPWQNCGLIIGGGATGKFYNNTITNGKGYPINCFGTGNIEISGNHIVMPNTSAKTAIYINDKLADKTANYVVKDNNIVTKHFPAINIINLKGRQPDLVKNNTIPGAPAKGFITYQGLKPVIQ